MFHDNQDMVKALHSKMLMCDVTAEQTVQVSTMKKKKNLEKEIDLQWKSLRDKRWLSMTRGSVRNSKKNTIKR